MSALYWMIGTCAVSILLVAVVFWKTPDWSRRGLFFSVTVPLEFAAGAEAGKILFRYRAIVAVTATMALFSLAWIGPWLIWAAPTAVGLHAFAALAGFLWARRRTQPFRQATGASSTLSIEPNADLLAADLLASPAPLPGGRLALVAPYLILVAVCGVLTQFWNEIPDSIATHYGSDGAPDGWAPKSWKSVFGLPFVALSVCIPLSLVSYSMMRWSRTVGATGESGRFDRTRQRSMAGLVTGLNLFLALLFGSLALAPLVRSPELLRGMIVTTLVVSVLLGPALLIWLVVRFSQASPARSSTAPGSPPGDNTSDEHWKFGLIYYNPQDSALFIEQRFGLGYTMNMAQGRSWWILGSVLVLPLLVVLLLF